MLNRAAAAQRGISMIEVLIALAIVGLLMALVAPSMGVWIQNTQLRNSADSILNGVQSARLEALKRNRPVSFRLTEAGSTAWEVCVYDPGADACSADPDAVIASKPASEGGPNARVGATDVTGTPTAAALAVGAGVPGSVTFDSFGRIANGPASNLVRVDVRNPTLAANEERRLVITVAVGGQIRLCDPQLSLASNPQGCE